MLNEFAPHSLSKARTVCTPQKCSENKERHQMKITVTEQIFLDEFKNSSRADQFSRDALVAIFAYITEAEGDVPADEGSDIELDVVGICCEYVEVENSDTDELESYSNCDVVAELDDSTVFIQS
jgi:hypothetical protein